MEVDSISKDLKEATTSLKQMFIGLMVFSLVVTIALVITSIKTQKNG